MNLPSLPDATKAVEQGDKTITNQTKTASEKPLAWTAVIGAILGGLLIIVLLILLIRSENKVSRLEGEKAESDRNNNTRLDAMRYYYENIRVKDDSTKNSLWYKLGAKDASK